MEDAPTTSHPELDLETLGRLARIRLREEDRAEFQPQLGRILGYVEQLSHVDVEGVEPMTHPVPLENVLREDRAVAPDAREAYLKNAPASRDGEVVVPRVIEE
jgi:aspartyl-tRNA(Asn)/glutamyl-tRNA(Gln) amidotransferase subunit C